MYLPEIQVFNLTIPTWFIFGMVNLLAMKALFIVLAHRRGIDWFRLLSLALLYTLGAAIGVIILPSIMGALAAGILFLFIGKWFLEVRQPIGDLVAINIALVVGIGRIGCLLNGCCFGTPTNLPWGISYPVGTPAHWLHLYTSQVAATNTLSLAVHPIQLYETIFLFSVALAIYRWGRRLNHPDALLPAFFGVYLWFRFFMEFIRDMTNVWWSALAVGPFSAFQWFLVATGGLLVIWVYLLERRPLMATAPEPAGQGRTYRQAAVVVVAFIGTALLHEQFQPVHLVQVLILFPLVTLTLVEQLTAPRPYRRLSVGFATALTGMLLLPLITQLRAQLKEQPISQLKAFQKPTRLYTIDPQTGKLLRLGDESLSYARFIRITGALGMRAQDTQTDFLSYKAAMGQLEEPGLHYYGAVSAGSYSYEVHGCDGEVTTLHNSYLAAMAGMEKVTHDKGYTTYLGMRAALHSTSGDDAYFAQSLLGYTRFDFRYVGIGLSGSLMPMGTWGGVPRILPGGHLRLGPSKFHIAAGFLDNYLLRTDPIFGHLSIGFTSVTGTRIKFGVTNLDIRPSFYFSSEMKLTSGGRFQPTLIFNPDEGVGLQLMLSN